MIDTVILILFLYFFYSGWCKGLLLTILGPILLVFCSIASYVYYVKTGNIIASLLISIIGPFTLNIAFSFLIRLSRTATKDDQPTFSLGKFFGGCLSLSWGGIVVLLILFLVMILPGDFQWLNNIQAAVAESRSYKMIGVLTNNKAPAEAFNFNKLKETLTDPKRMKKVESTQEFKDFIDDPLIHELFSDDETNRQIQERSISELLSNPKIQSILQDEEALKKYIALYQTILEAGELDVGESEEEKSKPRIIELDKL